MCIRDSNQTGIVSLVAVETVFCISHDGGHVGKMCIRDRAKDDTTNSRRVVFSNLHDKYAVTELFKEISVKIAAMCIRDRSTWIQFRNWLKQRTCRL